MTFYASNIYPDIGTVTEGCFLQFFSKKKNFPTEVTDLLQKDPEILCFYVTQVVEKTEEHIVCQASLCKTTVFNGIIEAKLQVYQGNAFDVTTEQIRPLSREVEKELQAASHFELPIILEWILRKSRAREKHKEEGNSDNVFSYQQLLEQEENAMEMKAEGNARKEMEEMIYRTKKEILERKMTSKL